MYIDKGAKILLFCGMDKSISKEEQRKARGRRIFKACAWILGPVLLLVLVLNFLDAGSVRRSDLVLRDAESGPLETSVAASGKLVPAFEEIVNSPLASSILEVYARPGDSVTAGQPLLRLDLREAQARYQNLRDAYDIKQSSLRQLQLTNRTTLADLRMQVRIKEMELNRLEIEVANERRLDSIGSGTGDRVRQAETAFATGRLELEGLRQRLDNETERLRALEEATALELGNSSRDLALMEQTLAQGGIPAPHDGVLTFLKTQLGSTVSVGEKLAVVGDLSSFMVEGDVPEGSSHKVRPGAGVVVRLGAMELKGTVASVEPQSTSGAVPFTVTLEDASNPRLRPGVRVQVYVDYGLKEQVVRIPVGGYYQGPGEYNLFVESRPGKLKRRKVRLGDSNRMWVEVVEGIAPGERVAVSDMSAFEKHKSISIK